MAVSYLRTGHGNGATKQIERQNVLCSETQILVMFQLFCKHISYHTDENAHIK